MGSGNFKDKEHRGNHSSTNGQETTDMRSGEFRNGRKSQYKNNNPVSDDVPTEYITNLKTD